MESATADAGGRGLFDDFGAFRSPTTEDFTAVLTGGLVAPDANVLLNLYRYTEQTRTDLLEALAALEDRVWVPHQVLAEFWRNRESTIGDARSSGTKAAEEMTGHFVEAVRKLRAWANRVALPDEEFERLRGLLARVFDDVTEAIVRVREGEGQSINSNTNVDPVIARLEPMLAGRVGTPLSREDHKKALEEARRRVDKREPPGYMDKKKEGDGAYGDYLVWEQIIREAVRRQCDVLFVTADAKEDWWRREQGFNRGPRPELTAELTARGGGRLFMLTPKRFLEVAAPILKFSLQEGSVEDIARVERIEAEETDDAPASFEDLLDRIADLPLLHFTGSREVTAGLDAVAYGSSWVRMAWDAVLALRDFAEAVAAGRTACDFRQWCSDAPSGVRTIAPRKIVRDESPSVKANIGWRRERILPVPEYVDPAGKIFMGDYVQIGGGNTIAPRLYYYDGACAEHGIFIGYIGLYLPNTSA